MQLIIDPSFPNAASYQIVIAPEPGFHCENLLEHVTASWGVGSNVRLGGDAEQLINKCGLRDCVLLPPISLAPSGSCSWLRFLVTFATP
jgi:hypothetical protein